MAGASVRSTGGQVDGLTMALIDSAYDKQKNVRDAICSALYDLGLKQPKLVLSSCASYLTKHGKLPKEHRILLLRTMAKIIKETIDKVPTDLAKELVHLGSNEIARSQEVVPDWQGAASNFLTALGFQFGDLVMMELLQHFSPTQTPHFFIIQTVGSLATQNVYSVVPHLKDLMGRMLPMMGAARQDNIRWVFASTIARFCESIIEYLANIEKAPKKNIKKEDFAGEVFSAYGVIFGAWSQTKELKLQLAIVEAVGYMAHLFETERLSAELGKIVNGYLAMYKRHPDHYFITLGMCQVLSASVADGSKILDPFIDVIMGTVHPLVCAPVNMSHSQSVKTHNELLRCVAVMATGFSDRIISFLFGKLDSSSERLRMGTLEIIRHIVNSCDDCMENKKSLIIGGLKNTLHEPSNKVKKMLAQTIIAMAHHNYLAQEGGHLMVEFIVRQCAMDDSELPMKGEKPDPEHVTNKQLRMMCNNVLHLMTTTVDCTEDVLYPYLLECIVPVQYTNSMSTVCSNLAIIAAKKRKAESEEYDLDYEVLVNIPKPAALISRLFVMAGQPHPRARGMPVLQLLQSMGPQLHEDISQLFDTVIPRLIAYLQDSEDNDKPWNQKSWEDLLLKLLSKTLDEVMDEEWISALGQEMGLHLNLYGHLPDEKNFLYKCIGVVMRKSTNKQFIADHLNLIFSTVKHTSQVEREGCAIALGFCAASHLDMAIEKLEFVTRNDMIRKSTGILGLMKDKSEADVERIKSTVMLCYGYVTLFAPIDLITSRVEVNILRCINPHFANVRDTGVKQNLIRTVELIGKALHPDHLKNKDFVFSKRADLLGHMQSYIKAEPLTTMLRHETVALATDACATLIKLEPRLSEADEFELIRICTDALFRLPSVVTAEKPREKEKGGADLSQAALQESEQLMEKSLVCLKRLLCQLLLKDVTAEGLQRIYKHLEPFITSARSHERLRSIDVCVSTLEFFYEKLEVPADSNAAQFFNLPSILARFGPRCSDESLPVRQFAVQGIKCTLKIAGLYDGQSKSEKDDIVEALDILKERSLAQEPNALFAMVNDCSKVLAKKVPSVQLSEFVFILLDGLIDPDAQSSSGTCVVLNSLMRQRGGELSTEVEKFVKSVHERLGRIVVPQTRTGTLRSLRTFAGHHLIAVLTTLLEFPLPYDPSIVSCWQTLAGDKQLTKMMFEHVLDLLTNSLPYKERAERGAAPVFLPAPGPMAATCALTEIFRTDETEEVVQSMFHRLFSQVILRIGCATVIRKPEQGKNAAAVSDPAKDAVACLRELLVRTELSEVVATMDEAFAFNMLGGFDFPQGITILGRALCLSAPKYVGQVVTSLTGSLSSLYEQHRVVTCSFFAELINQKCLGDMTLVEMQMNSLLGRLIDQSHIVRMLCIRGLGNVSELGSDQVHKYSTTILSAMMSGMDDRDDPMDLITLESMSGLSKIISQIEEGHVRAILINIALRIRPCFEKPKPEVRAAAFTLFGKLSKFGDGPSRAPFLEQIHNNFISLLMHMNEGDMSVVTSCKEALREVGPLLGSEAVNEMFQRHLIPGGSLHYGEFMNDLARLLIADFNDKISFYAMGCVTFFKSMWPPIKANAAMFVGFLLGNLPMERRKQMSKEHICGALILLLRDPAPEVRIAAASASSLLFEF
eukprot:scpid12251/ scgid8580/ HEAT repeat-containing protein 7A